MSYDLFVFDPGAASGRAAQVYEAVCEGITSAAGHSVVLRRFVERLEAAIPEVFDESEVEDASLDPDGNYVLVSLPRGCDQAIVDGLVATAAGLGLATFDPQRELSGGETQPLGRLGESGRHLDMGYQWFLASGPAAPGAEARSLLFFDATAALVDARTLFATPSALRRMKLAGKSRRVARFVQRMRREYPEIEESGGSENWSRAGDPGNYFMFYLDPAVSDEDLTALADLARD